MIYLSSRIIFEIAVFYAGISGNYRQGIPGARSGNLAGTGEGWETLIQPWIQRYIPRVIIILMMKVPCLLLLLMAGFLILAGCTSPGRGTGGAVSPAPVSPSPSPSGPVIEADAYPPGEPYEIDPRFVRNTPEYRVDPALFIQVYSKRFTMNYNSVGLLATVEKAPLVIDFAVVPGSDNPNYAFFILTVRDADEKVVVGQEGYARTFSTESPKRMVFTRPGRYHLNLYGTMVDVNLLIRMKM